MKPKITPVLHQCIETGIKLGINRSRKYSEDQRLENLSDEYLEDAIYNAIMNEIYEWFDFEDTN